MDYKIANSSGDDFDEVVSELEEIVNFLIRQGYKPQGGVSTTEERYGYTGYYTASQAMIKE